MVKSMSFKPCKRQWQTIVIVTTNYSLQNVNVG